MAKARSASSTGAPVISTARRSWSAPAGWTFRRSRDASVFRVRNLVWREGSSFFLQKADGRFYPDFLCQLLGSADQPAPIPAVEYKGADRWTGAEDDRLIGRLRANLSGGRCSFVMVKDNRWEWIEEKQ